MAAVVKICNLYFLQSNNIYYLPNKFQHFCQSVLGLGYMSFDKKAQFDVAFYFS